MYNIKRTIILVADMVLVAVAAVFFIFFYYGMQLPNELILLNYSPPVTTKIFSADGVLIDEYAIERRTIAKIEDVPNIIKSAFIIAEDKDFYKHAGISISSLIRAIVENTSKKTWNKKPSGGSTITQQVAKNILVGNKKNISRKIKEAIMAFRIESSLSKDKILEIYLNHIYLGKGCYGIKEACRYYFAKDINHIAPEEAAFIASLASAPSVYANFHDKLILKRNAILKQMYLKKILTKEQTLTAIAKPIKIKMKRTQRIAPFFTEELHNYLMKYISNHDFLNGGYIIVSTLNSKIQKIATKCLENGLIKHEKTQEWTSTHSDQTLEELASHLPRTVNKIFPVLITSIYTNYCTGIDIKNNTYNISTKHLIITNKENRIEIGKAILCRKAGKQYEAFQQPATAGGIIVIDADSGEILAMSGGYSFDISSFNCATQARRQPGSAIKPFIYATAFDYGISEDDYIEDKKVTFRLRNGNFYTPKNYNGQTMGKIRVKNGLIYSQNLATLNLARKVGINNIYTSLKNFGLIGQTTRISYLLGAYETTLLKLMHAFSAFTSQGKMITPSLVKTIIKDGKQILQNINKKSNKQIISPESAATTKQIMHDAAKYGTASGLAKTMQEYNVILGGKTGTSNDCKDAWFIGYVEYNGKTLLVGIFVGYPFPRSLGQNATGARVALPIFREFVEKYIKYCKSQ